MQEHERFFEQYQWSIRGILRALLLCLLAFWVFQSILNGQADLGKLLLDLIWLVFVVLSCMAVWLTLEWIQFSRALVRHFRLNYTQAQARLINRAWLTLAWLILILLVWASYGLLGFWLRMIDSWSPVLVSRWVFTFPSIPDPPDWVSELWLSVLKIAAPVLLLLYLAWTSWRLIFEWRLGLRLLGWHNLAGRIMRMTRLLYRQPWRQMVTNTPGASLLVPLLLLLGFHQADELSAYTYFLLTLVFLALGVVNPLSGLIPPVLVWLSVSDYDQFRVLKNLQKILPGCVRTLINQASPDISQQYYSYYGRRLARHRAYASGRIGKSLAAMEWSLAPLFMNPRGPRAESLRTRPGLWRQTVRDLIDIAPIVVIDVRKESQPVLEEIVWMLAPDRIHKAIFLTNPDGAHAPIEGALPAGMSLYTSGAIVCNETFLYFTVRAMILSAKTLPKPNQYYWPARIENMKKQLDELLDLVKDKQFDHLELDRRVSDWDCATSDRLVESPIPAYSSSLDTALSLIKQRLPHASMTIYIYTNGTALVELGILDGHGDFLVYTSTREDHLLPPRAALQALFKAERGVEGVSPA